MALNDNQLERSITLRYKLLKPQLMKSGNHPFTITYRVNYALTNSHHSLSFKPGEKIEIETLFSPIVQFESPHRTMQFTNIASSSRQIQDKSLESESKRFINFGLGGEDNPENNDQNHTNLVLKQDINLNPDRLSNNNHRIQEISRELGLRT